MTPAGVLKCNWCYGYADDAGTGLGAKWFDGYEPPQPRLAYPEILTHPHGRPTRGALPSFRRFPW